jgi:hypothetical protein
MTQVFPAKAGPTSIVPKRTIKVSCICKTFSKNSSEHYKFESSEVNLI